MAWHIFDNSHLGMGHFTRDSWSLEKKINHHDAAYEQAYSFGALMSSFESFAFFMAPLSDHCAIGRAITKRPRIILHTTSFA